MTDEFKEVFRVNQSFYHALERGDIELMEEVWMKDENAKCVHPGWPMLLGWEAIKQSWKNIFDAGGPVKIDLSDINTEIAGDAAWITCIEHITHTKEGQLQTGLAQTTNIFERHGSKWLLILHHASPVPMKRAEVAGEKLQ